MDIRFTDADGREHTLTLELDPGTPLRWDDPIAEYVHDHRPVPEHWGFYQDHNETLRVYSEGNRIEAWNGEITDLAELERRATGALSALIKAREQRGL